MPFIAELPTATVFWALKVLLLLCASLMGSVNTSNTFAHDSKASKRLHDCAELLYIRCFILNKLYRAIAQNCVFKRRESG